MENAMIDKDKYGLRYTAVSHQSAEADARMHTARGTVLPMHRAEELQGLPNNPGYAFAKRALDIVLSAMLLLVLALPMLVLAALVRLDSKGPAIFRQERLGLGGKPFTIFKFRSMRLDAEANGAKWAEKDDPRVTRAGRVMRIMRLDELPQLFNILRGEMSFVGPRPERAVFYIKFEQHIQGFSQRLMVKPGLTGYAQINGGYNLQPQEKLRYDLEYIKHRSMRMDLWLMMRTVGVVLRHEGAR